MSLDVSITDPLVTLGDNGTPWSERFKDTYFDTYDGLAESRHVFLDGCGLPDAWQDQDHFVIGETGFGTGLNFLATWHLWRQSCNSDQTLHYLSVEGFPLDRATMMQCLQPWPELEPLAGQLLEAYPDPQPGMHRLIFDQDRVVLTLLCGPALPVLRDLDAQVDAWFLDGFAPDRNPEMWTRNVFQEIARCSKPTAKLATFTVAGRVRTALQDVGFHVEKRSGAGRKREVLAGRYQSDQSKQLTDPWYAPAPIGTGSRPRVAIIGSGLAGANLAYAFRRRSCPTTVIERTACVASESSSVPGAVFMPRLTAGKGPDGAFYAMAWRYAVSLIADLLDDTTESFKPCGVLHLAKTKDDLKRCQTIAAQQQLPASMMTYVDDAEASRLAQIPLDHGGLYFPHGCWLEPQRLCEQLLKGCTVQTQKTVGACVQRDNEWTLFDTDDIEIGAADVVVLANGLAATQVPQASWLPLIARRGQISRFAATSESTALQCVIAGDGYVLPAIDGVHTIGATFDHIREEDRLDPHPEPTQDGDAYNMSLLEDMLPGLCDQPEILSEQSWTGLRCTTADHLPLTGPLPDHERYTEDFADMRHGRRPEIYPQATYHTGLFVLTGLGARGLVAAPLAAELVASQACGEPLPVPHSVATALHPGRFTVRDLKRLKA